MVNRRSAQIFRSSYFIYNYASMYIHLCVSMHDIMALSVSVQEHEPCKILNLSNFLGTYDKTNLSQVYITLN